MSLSRKTFPDRSSWLAGRQLLNGIGGSEAAAVCGVSKWQTPVELWEEKTKRRQPKDLSGVDYVELGVKTEGPMRDLFAAMHPEYKVDWHPFDILYQDERPWLFATLDGELTDLATGDRGILEIKKFEVSGKADWQQWDNRVPEGYFCQVLHQMLATGWDFAWLFALLIQRNGNCSLRPYYFPREEYGDDLKWLLGKEESFVGYVKRGRVPPTPLRL